MCLESVNFIYLTALKGSYQVFIPKSDFLFKWYYTKDKLHIPTMVFALLLR